MNRKLHQSKTTEEGSCMPVGTNVLNIYGITKHWNPWKKQELQQIQPSYLANPGVVVPSESFRLWLPNGVDDIESWLLELATLMGWSSLEEAATQMSLPSERMLVYSKNVTESNQYTIDRIVRTAIVLAKCNDTIYDPQAQMLFTRKRMERRLTLFSINLEKYYEVD